MPIKPKEKRPGLWQRLTGRLLGQPEAGSGLRQAAVKLLRNLYLGGHQFLEDFCWERAAALAFITVISLLPFSVIFLNILGLFLQEAALRGFVKDQVLAYFTPEELKEEVRKWIEANIRTDLLKPGAGINLIAVAALVITALALIVWAERVFNRIWKVHRTRNYFQKFTAFWTILTTSPVLVGISFFIDSYVRREVFGLMERYLVLRALYGFLVPLLVTWAAFTLLLLLLPNTRVRLQPALLGGCISGLLWEGLKNGFYLYFKQAGMVTNLYGSLGAVPVFLVFVYLTWLIILFGAELSYAAQNHLQLINQYRRRTGHPRYSPQFLGVFYLERLMRSYHRGDPIPGLEEVAGELDLTAADLQAVAEKLEDLGVLAESAASGDLLVPVRAPGTVPLREVVEQLLLLGAREEQEPPSPSGPGKGEPGQTELGAGARRLLQGRKAYLDVFTGMTLADLGAREGGSDPPSNGS